jgi:hypothetical protein
LFQYGNQLKHYIEKEESILGLIGFVKFPRDDKISVLHAGVLMSYLTFIFEIAGSNIYSEPAWGVVTANILFKKFPTCHSIDTRYAKETGGREDVDFALRLSRETGGLKLKCCPSAKVTHLFWSGEMLSQLCRHFFNWENGDSALFDRFAGESLVYLSYPNFIETWFVLALPLSFLAASNQLLHLIFATLAMFASDVIVDMSWNSGGDFTHRLSLLEQQEVSTRPFVVFAHFLANLYVVVLECGR